MFCFVQENHFSGGWQVQRLHLLGTLLEDPNMGEGIRGPGCRETNIQASSLFTVGARFKRVEPS